MRQDNSAPKGNNEAAPPSSMLNSLSTLASTLAKIHPADIFGGAHALALFAGAEMREVNFTAGHGTHSTTEELAATVLAILRSSPKEFAGVLPMYGKLLDMVNTFCFEITEGAYQGFGPAEFEAAHLVCAELDRIELNLGTEGDAEPYIDPVESFLLKLTPAAMARILSRQSIGEKSERLYSGEVVAIPHVSRPGLRQIIRDRGAMAAAICVAVLIWDISQDGLLLWQIAAAFGLALVIAGLAFRLGRIQTPVSTLRVAEDREPAGKAAH